MDIRNSLYFFIGSLSTQSKQTTKHRNQGAKIQIGRKGPVLNSRCPTQNRIKQILISQPTTAYPTNERTPPRNKQTRTSRLNLIFICLLSGGLELCIKFFESLILLELNQLNLCFCFCYRIRNKLIHDP